MSSSQDQPTVISIGFQPQFYFIGDILWGAKRKCGLLINDSPEA
jgi:hypothetical protein